MELGVLGVRGILALLHVEVELSQKQEPVTPRYLPMVEPPAQLVLQVTQSPKPATPRVA